MCIIYIIIHHKERIDMSSLGRLKYLRRKGWRELQMGAKGM